MVKSDEKERRCLFVWLGQVKRRHLPLAVGLEPNALAKACPPCVDLHLSFSQHCWEPDPDGLSCQLFNRTLGYTRVSLCRSLAAEIGTGIVDSFGHILLLSVSCVSWLVKVFSAGIDAKNFSAGILVQYFNFVQEDFGFAVDCTIIAVMWCGPCCAVLRLRLKQQEWNWNRFRCLLTFSRLRVRLVNVQKENEEQFPDGSKENSESTSAILYAAYSRHSIPEYGNSGSIRQ